MNILCNTALQKQQFATRPVDKTFIAGEKKYDGNIRSLAAYSHRPHSHPNQHTEEEITLVKNMRRRNPHDGLVVLWVKLRLRGYTRTISELYKLLQRIGGSRIKLPNPQYIAKPYEQMQYPGQKVHIDVKFHMPLNVFRRIMDLNLQMKWETEVLLSFHTV